MLSLPMELPSNVGGLGLLGNQTYMGLAPNSTSIAISSITPDPFNVSHVTPEKCAAEQYYCNIRVIIDVFLIGTLCVVGLVGNTVAIFVLRMDNVNNTVSFLLQALAVADNSYLISCLFFQTMKSLAECTDWVPHLKETYPFMEPYVWPCASISQTITVWLIVLVTLDRYIAICKPFETMRLCTTQRAKRAVVLVLFAAILYNIPRFFEQHVQFLPDYCHRIYRFISRHTAIRKNRIYFIVYKTCMFFFFRIILPMSILVTVNTRLAITLRSARRDRAKLTKSLPKNDYFTLIMVAVVTVFIFCQIPDFIIRTLVTIGKFTGTRFNVKYYVLFSNMMLTLNSSVNCLIYCLTGRRFRKILKRLVCKSFSGPHHRPLVSDEPFATDGQYHNSSTIRPNLVHIEGNTTSTMFHKETKI